jgi:hypothetical protein
MSIENFKAHHPRLVGVFAAVAAVGIAMGTSLGGVFAARAAGCAENATGMIELASIMAGSFLGTVAGERIIRGPMPEPERW